MLQLNKSPLGGRLFLLTLIVFFLQPAAAIGQNNPYSKRFILVDNYIDSLMKEWNVPGLALAIVYKDQLVYGRGYGYRDLEKKLPVETNTLFPIASNTKLFTSTVACMLQEEGKLSIDRPVKVYHPSLNFSNDELNAKVTLRDLLSHRTGLPRYDGIWGKDSFTRDQLVSKISYMKPQLGFREGYIYNNMMFATAGSVLEKVAGKSWEDLVRNKLLEPLDMKATCFTQDEMIKYGNYSLSYFEIDSTRQLKAKQYVAMSNAVGPAGSIKSSVEDMGKWMIAQLNSGNYKGRSVIPVAVINQTLVPNAIADKSQRWSELSNSLYCLGRTIQSYKGLKLASHTGSIDGFYSNLSFLPEKELAVFIVFNQVEAGSLRSVISLPVFDILLGLDRTPWIQRYRNDYLDAKRLQKRFADSVNATQVRNTQPSHPLTAYAGTYQHPVYGKVIINAQGDALQFNFRGQQSVLRHFHYDQFITAENKTDFPNFRLNFLTNQQGNIDRISTQFFGDPQMEFTRVN